MRIRWHVQPGMRCDIVTYGAPNLTGKRGQVRIFPSGSQQGQVDSLHVRSMVIRAPHGTRVVLVSSPGADWEASAWRCIRVVPGRSMPSERSGGLPGVRIPDLDLLDRPDAKRTDTQVESTYPHADTLASGEGWTFGRVGELKGCVELIRVEKDADAPTHTGLPAENVARAVLERAAAVAPDALPDLIAVAVEAVGRELAADGRKDARARADALRTWADGLRG